MRFTKPAWVAHHDNHEPTKRVSIFSVSVHPDGSRVATAGLDAKIRIWATAPILSAQMEAQGVPKSLCTLTMHNGPVMVVRWASNGKWLASGSDDTLVMIWDLDPNGGGKVWGSDDINIEGWKALRRLTGHESDVVDCAWAPDDRYLASVGLDSRIFIWCGYTLECVRRLDGHQGFVKGVCWDPVGEFLATQSDDKSVKIWRSTDWTLQATVTKPFETSPGSAFYNRLSWSPDASYLCASNAMNNNGAVFVAAVIERDTWNSNMSLVGHENTVEVAAYNPRLFKRDSSIPLPANSPAKRSVVSVSDLVDDEPPETVFSVVALGADDRSISVWRTTDARPLVVAKEVFDRQILDLGWAWDGQSIWACSSDGTIAVLDFSVSEGAHGRKGEMEGITSAQETKDYIKSFEFPWPPPVEANYAGYANGYQPNAQVQYQHNAYAPAPYQDSGYGGSRPGMPTPMQSSVGVGHAPPPINQAQKVTMTKSGKKRIQPTFLGGGSAVMTSSGAMPPPASSPMKNGYAPSPIGAPGEAPRGGRGMDWAADSYNQPSGSGSRSSRSGSMSRPADGRPPGHGFQLPPGSRVPGTGEARVLMQPPNVSPRRQNAPVGAGNYPYVLGLEVPVVRSHVSAGHPGDLVIEGRNPDEPNVPTEIVCAHGSSILWADFVPARVLAVVKTPALYAASLEDSSIIVYTPAGRRAMPTLSLDAPISIIAAAGKYLMAICVNGSFHTWNVHTRTSTIPPTSIANQVHGGTGGITQAKIYENGVSLITLASGTSIAWDPDLSAWVRLAENWWRQSTSQPPRTPSRPGRQSEPGLSPIAAHHTGSEETPLSAALRLGALETRLYASKLLGSAADYREVLMTYAAKLAEDNLVERADELVRELCGPVFWDPTRPEMGTSIKWNPKILGLNKRDLLQEALPILARGRALSRMAQDWQVLLARIETERNEA